MSIEADEAGAMLAEIERIGRQVKQSALYRASGVVLMFWGVVIVAGNLAELVVGRWTGLCWAALDAVGVAGTVMLLAQARRGTKLRWQLLAAFALFFGFGLAWSLLLGGFRARELDAFWPTLFLFGYALSGLWLGRAFTAIGVGLAVLVLAGYLWAGAAYGLYLAAVNGGGLILCGLWMRRA